MDLYSANPGEKRSRQDVGDELEVKKIKQEYDEYNIDVEETKVAVNADVINNIKTDIMFNLGNKQEAKAQENGIKLENIKEEITEDTEDGKMRIHELFIKPEPPDDNLLITQDPLSINNSPEDEDTIVKEEQSKDDGKIDRKSKTADVSYHYLDADTEEFISEIGKQPAIWNRQCEGYSNKLVKCKAWEAVITKFLPGFQEQDAYEKKIIVRNYVHKWKGLRDSYISELLRTKKGRSSQSGPKQYSFFKHMGFLDEYVLNKLEGMTQETLLSASTSRMRDKRNAKEHTVHIDKKIKNKRSRNEHHRTQVTINNEPRKGPLDAEGCSYTQVLLKYYNYKSPDENEDEDRLFLLSLVPELKKLPACVKMETKAEMLNILKKARTQADSTNIHP